MQTPPSLQMTQISSCLFIYLLIYLFIYLFIRVRVKYSIFSLILCFTCIS